VQVPKYQISVKSGSWKLTKGTKCLMMPCSGVVSILLQHGLPKRRHLTQHYTASQPRRPRLEYAWHYALYVVCQAFWLILTTAQSVGFDPPTGQWWLSFQVHRPDRIDRCRSTLCCMTPKTTLRPRNGSSVQLVALESQPTSRRILPVHC
jgi:hypothetical protein